MKVAGFFLATLGIFVMLSMRGLVVPVLVGAIVAALGVGVIVGAKS